MPKMLPALARRRKVKFAYLTEVLFHADSVNCANRFWTCLTLYGPAEVEMVRAVTGWDVTVEELMAVGERRLNLMRTFNAREGLDRAQDKLPKKFFKALKGQGPTAGMALDEKEINKAIDEYYRLAHWTERGVPTPAQLKKLDIGWAAAYLPG
jgi:aldehyde:ferredoxin oxidoreductase